MDEGLAKRFKDLCQGRGQPDERDFAAALLALDSAGIELQAQVAENEKRGQENLAAVRDHINDAVRELNAQLNKVKAAIPAAASVSVVKVEAGDTQSP